MTAAKKSSQLPVISEQLAAKLAEPVVVHEIALELLEANAKNPRQTMVEADLAELAASIRMYGVIVPLLVRHAWCSVWVEFEDGTHDSMQFATMAECSDLLRRPGAVKTEVDDHYEIVAGHQRCEAATLAGLTTVPCIVRALTDEEASVFAIVDNLLRVDVQPLDEAKGYELLRQTLGTPAAIASRVGKDAAYVARRLQLVSLAELPRKALAERLINIDHALLLARLGVDEQNVNLKWALNTNAGMKESVESVIEQRIQERDRTNRFAPWEPQSPLSLKNHIEEHVGRKLNRAPWDLDDAKLLSDAPACNLCPANTKANDALFGDLSIDAATCEDGGCFERKREAFVQINLSAATVAQDAELGPALRVSFKSTTVKPRAVKDGDGFNPHQTFKAGQWIEAKKKSCEHARAAVSVDWNDDRFRTLSGTALRRPGQTLTVCVAEKCKAHPKAWEQAASKGRGGAASEAERQAAREREMAKFKAFAAEEAPVRRALYEQILSAIKPETVRRNAILSFLDFQSMSSICWGEDFKGGDYREQEKYVKKRVEKATAAELDVLLFHATFGSVLVVDAVQMWAADRGRGKLRELAAVVGVNALAIERKFDQLRKLPEPTPAKKGAGKAAPKKQAAARKKMIGAVKAKLSGGGKKDAGAKGTAAKGAIVKGSGVRGQGSAKAPKAAKKAGAK